MVGPSVVVLQVKSVYREANQKKNTVIGWYFTEIHLWKLKLVMRSEVAILVSGCRPTSDSVGSMTIESGVVENVGVATGISLISQSNPEIWRTSGL